MKLLLATCNRHKAGEIAPMLEGLDIELLTLEDLPDIIPTEEDGETLEDNARKKAAGPAMASGLWTLADDTGLEVDALGGAPGVYSARYAGPDCDFHANTSKLLDELAGVEAGKRGAAFRTVVALSSPEGEVRCVEGRLDGVIADIAAGTGGFGYDPVFLVPELGKTLAEIGPQEKNRISHRGRAIRAVLPLLKELMSAV